MYRLLIQSRNNNYSNFVITCAPQVADSQNPRVFRTTLSPDQLQTARETLAFVIPRDNQHRVFILAEAQTDSFSSLSETLLHELSHFGSVASSLDFVYIHSDMQTRRLPNLQDANHHILSAIVWDEFDGHFDEAINMVINEYRIQNTSPHAELVCLVCRCYYYVYMLKCKIYYDLFILR